jgi:hypothetical protein
LLITRLKNATPQSPLAAALGEYGRVVRTNFLLSYCADPAQRARIAGQLNKGETLHALRRHLVIGSGAQLPADEDDHRRHALCLQILVNAVEVWNARYMTAAIDHLHATQPEVVADDQHSRASLPSRTPTSTRSAATSSTGNRRPQANSGLYAGSTTTPTEPSRHHRSASVATMTLARFEAPDGDPLQTTAGAAPRPLLQP